MKLNGIQRLMERAYFPPICTFPGQHHGRKSLGIISVVPYNTISAVKTAIIP
jgi:hypothetical protein